MSTFRIALANLRFPASPEDSVRLAEQAIPQASADGAGIVCFPECFVPGYRIGKPMAPPEPEFLESAWARIAAAAAKAKIAVILGTERVVGQARRISALVINPDGTVAGFRTKCSSIRPRTAPFRLAASGGFSRPVH